MKKKILVVVGNLQNDFADVLGVNDVHSVATQVVTVVRGLVAKGYEVVVAVFLDDHDPDHNSFYKFERHCVRRSTGAALVMELHGLPAQVQIVMFPRSRHRYDDATSVFANTSLLYYIAGLRPDVIIPAGATAQVGMYALMSELMMVVKAGKHLKIDGFPGMNAVRPELQQVVRRSGDYFHDVEICTAVDLVAALPDLPADVSFEDARLIQNGVNLFEIQGEADWDFLPVDKNEALRRAVILGILVMDSVDDLLEKRF